MCPAPSCFQACNAAWGLFVTLTVLLGTHAWMCFRMARQARSAQLMLNPVSSGLLQV